jgi:alpha-L-arabinofuranosidase
MRFPRGNRSAIENYVIFATLALGLTCHAQNRVQAGSKPNIEVDAGKVTGEVHPFLFGQFIEHEHKTIQGGIWAELLRDRKFEEGDANRDGVSDGWVPEERIRNHYWEIVHGQGTSDRYFVDRQEFYGGGASQAIQLYGTGPAKTSIYQIGLEVMKGHPYTFYVYLKQRGAGKVWVELDRLGGAPYGHQEFSQLSDHWEKYSAEFTPSEDTKEARLRIGVEGQGTFWIDSASLMPRDNFHGMRSDVIEALKPLRLPILRYPGGCFADEYHWRNGIGPRDQRPATWSTIWQEWDPNDFGIDEYMEFARQLGFQPHITANYSTGTPEEAARWVEYTNGSAETTGGKLRAQNGHPEPYNIKWWAIGNESARSCAEAYTGGTKIDEYAERFQRYSAAMRKADSSLRIMAGGAPPGPDSWNHDLLGLMPVDLLTLTMYTGDYLKRHTEISDPAYYYRQVVADPQKFDRWLDQLIGNIGDRFPRDRPLLAITEYNSYWLPETLDPDYRLCNALYLAGVFHALFHHANQVAIAEWNTLVNVQGLLGVNPTGVKLTPPYLAYLLYRNHTGTQVLSTQSSSAAVAFNSQLPSLDAIATLSQDGTKLYLAVTNASETDDEGATIRLKNWASKVGESAKAWELNGKDRDAANPYGSATNVNIQEKQFTLGHAPFAYRFPAHSVTVLEISGHADAASK